MCRTYTYKLAGTFFRSLILVLTCVSASYAQEPEGEKTPVDTLDYMDTKIIIYSDHSWEFIPIENFDGILNPFIHGLVATDTSLKFKTDWNTSVVFSMLNDINRLQDTVWLCSIDTAHTNWCIPVDGAVLSSFKYRGARFHHGLDMDLDIGDPVKAAFDGIVRYAQYNKGGFGNCVIIRHYNGLETIYAHLSKINVRPYQRVSACEIIGLGGNTGRSYGPHLHFECRFYDHAFDPQDVFDFENKKLRDENLFICPSKFDYREVSKKNVQMDRYRNNPDMIKKIEEDYEHHVIHSGSDNQQTKVVATNVTPNNKTPNRSTPRYHKVKSGDTLSGIARKYGTSIDKLCRLNGISRTTLLRIDQRIRYQ